MCPQLVHNVMMGHCSGSDVTNVSILCTVVLMSLLSVCIVCMPLQVFVSVAEFEKRWMVKKVNSA